MSIAVWEVSSKRLDSTDIVRCNERGVASVGFTGVAGSKCADESDDSTECVAGVSGGFAYLLYVIWVMIVQNDFQKKLTYRNLIQLIKDGYKGIRYNG